MMILDSIRNELNEWVELQMNGSTECSSKNKKKQPLFGINSNPRSSSFAIHIQPGSISSSSWTIYSWLSSQPLKGIPSTTMAITMDYSTIIWSIYLTILLPFLGLFTITLLVLATLAKDTRVYKVYVQFLLKVFEVSIATDHEGGQSSLFIKIYSSLVSVL